MYIKCRNVPPQKKHIPNLTTRIRLINLIKAIMAIKAINLTPALLQSHKSYPHPQKNPPPPQPFFGLLDHLSVKIPPPPANFTPLCHKICRKTML